jgi:hypothetical protein
MVGDHTDGAFIVFSGGRRHGEGKAQVPEELAEVFCDLSGIASSDNLGFGGQEGGGALYMASRKDSIPSKHDDNTRDIVRVPEYQQSTVRSTHVAHRLVSFPSMTQPSFSKQD